MSPAAAILVVDFWLLRKQKWNIPDLYNPEGIYWFQYGLNWRAFGRSNLPKFFFSWLMLIHDAVAYFLGMWPAVPASSPMCHCKKKIVLMLTSVAGLC
jgi:NCS1 family nucleobase:cation symporter-1